MNPKIPKKMQVRHCKRCDKSLVSARVNQFDNQREFGSYRGGVMKYCPTCSKIIVRERSKMRGRMKNPKKGLTVCFTCKGSMPYHKSKFCCARCRNDHYILTRIQKSIDIKTKFLQKQKLKRQKILDHYRNVQRLVAK